VSNSYFDVPELITLSAVESRSPQPQLGVVFQAATEKAALGIPGKTVGDIVYNSTANILLVSLGDASKIIADTFRLAGGALARWLIQNNVATAEITAANVGEFSVPNALPAVCEGLLLGMFKFDRHKKKTTSAPPVNITVRAQNDAEFEGVAATVKRATILVRAVNLARDWGHEPANIINPVTLAERSQALAERHGLKCTILD